MSVRDSGWFLFFQLSIVDVKLNLQETDYGNFLADEVRC